MVQVCKALEIKGIDEKITQFFKDNALEDCFFVEASVKGKKIEIFIDRDGGISFDVCKKVSRFLEADFDESKIFGDDYVLEVSSPGVGSPLKLPRQYINNTGRDIEVLAGDQKIKGLLLKADDQMIAVQFEEIVKEGKKKKKNLVTTEIKYADIKSAKIKISFK